MDKEKEVVDSIKKEAKGVGIGLILTSIAMIAYGSWLVNNVNFL